MISRAGKAGLSALVWAVLVAVLAACASTHRSAVLAPGVSAATTSSVASGPPSTTAVPPPTTGQTALVPTVPNCGGGAYKPQTLLIVCGNGTTMATSVSWRSWQPAAAQGSGTVHLQVNGQAVSAPAALLLSDVVNGPVGPQFTLLTVTWTGTPPDGKAQDLYHLQIQG